MSLMQLLLFRISAYCRCRIINGPDQTPYLERYHLLKLPFDYQLYLHRFVASDPGRGLHNHPWTTAISMVLCGEYEEVRMADSSKNNNLNSRRLRAGRLNWINGSVFHRINITGNSEPWTLFLHGPKSKSWGFLHKRYNRYAFHDHDALVNQASDPSWWKTASRPVNCASMRKPASFPVAKRDHTGRKAA